MVASVRNPVDVRGVSRAFGSVVALDEVSLQVPSGHIEALLGRNGAGKTTLLRILAGLVTPDTGSVRVAGVDAVQSPLAVRREIGLVPSGDRSFYLRISGLENLVFFARLQGIRRREAVARARRALAQVGLEDAARGRVGTYSHGMQKRLGVARALLTSPAVLLVDEATHDLDPDGARAVRALIRNAADEGAAVVWATQRLEEIRGFADGVTLIDRGVTRFRGSVDDLIAHALVRRYVLTIPADRHDRDAVVERAAAAVAGDAVLTAVSTDGDRYVLDVSDGAVLGDVLAALTSAELPIVACRPDGSDIEEAFVALTGAR